MVSESLLEKLLRVVSERTSRNRIDQVNIEGKIYSERRWELQLDTFDDQCPVLQVFRTQPEDADPLRRAF